jgi:opacity protein-like surface antigen
MKRICEMKQVNIKRLIVVNTILFASYVSAQPLMKDEISNTRYHDWTGFYIGVNAGAVNHTMDITDTNAVFFDATVRQVSDPQLTGGIQAGYRRQLDHNRVSGVYGVELNANLTNARFSTQYGSSFALYQLDSEDALDAIVLLQLLGGIAVDRTLLFLAAGLSWAHITGYVDNLDSIMFSQGFDVDKKAWGSAIGAGIEYALTEQCSLRFKLDVITPHTYFTTDNLGNHFNIANHIVQGSIGLNYTFA